MDFAANHRHQRIRIDGSKRIAVKREQVCAIPESIVP
jgi:hypothetical protein